MSSYSFNPSSGGASSAEVTALDGRLTTVETDLATEQAKPISFVYGAVSAVGQTPTPNSGAAADGRRIPIGYEVTTAGTAQLGIQYDRAVTLRNLRVFLNSAGGDGTSTNVTLIVGGVATALTVAIASNDSTGVSNTSDSVNVPAQTLVEFTVHHAADIGATLLQLFLTCEVHAQ